MSPPSRYVVHLTSQNTTIKYAHPAVGRHVVHQFSVALSLALFISSVCLWSMTLLKYTAYFDCTESRLVWTNSGPKSPGLFQGEGYLNGLSESRVGGERWRLGESGGLSESPPAQLTIFSVFRNYSARKDSQLHVLQSWLNLSPPANVVLVGHDPGLQRLANKFPGRVVVEREVDTNFLGEPLFNSLLTRARSANTKYVMLATSDLIILNDLWSSVSNLDSAFPDWLMTGCQWKPPLNLTVDTDSANARNHWLDRLSSAEIEAAIRKDGRLHTLGGVGWFLWNNTPLKLHTETMPPFTWGHGEYESWLIRESSASGLWAVVDASETVIAFSDPRHSDAAPEAATWQSQHNVHLAGLTGNHAKTPQHLSWKLTVCREPKVNNLCMQQRARPANCSCDYSPFAPSTDTDPILGAKNQWTCGNETTDTRIPPLSLRESHTLDRLLPQVALQRGGGVNVVTLVAVSRGYRDLLMSFVCQLRRLGLSGNLVVAALDEEIYHFAARQGLAVYYESGGVEGVEEVVGKGKGEAFPVECLYRSACFRKLTKMKSKAVLRVLRKGYSVLLSDVDVVWLGDPLPDMEASGSGSMSVQSNEPNSTLAANGVRRLNSGLYFARADEMTIEAFAAIVDAGKRNEKLGEQPLFYDVLCGERGKLRVKGRGDECKWTNGLRVVFLDRDKFPNGAVNGLWEEEDPASVSRNAGGVALHNNWIVGREAKEERLVEKRLWFYDRETTMCVYTWTRKETPMANRQYGESPTIDPESMAATARVGTALAIFSDCNSRTGSQSPHSSCDLIFSPVGPNRSIQAAFRSESLSLIDARKLSTVRNIRRNVTDEGIRAPRCCLSGEHGDLAGRGGFAPAKAVRISDRELADAAVDTSVGVQGEGDSEPQPHKWRGSAEGLASVEEAVEALKNGQILLLVDHQNASDEGDFLVAASLATEEAIGFMVYYGSGLVLVPAAPEVLDRLKLPLLVEGQSSGLAFALTVDKLEGTTTGISGSDRMLTVRHLADPTAEPEDFRRPGHVIPIRTCQGGVLRQPGHAEAAVDLATLAGLPPVGVLCTVTDENGETARLPRLIEVAKEHGMLMVSVGDIIRYRQVKETIVERSKEAPLDTLYGSFRMVCYTSLVNGIEHTAMVKGDVGDGEDVLIRVHSECLTGDIFGSARCDCGPQLSQAMERIAAEGRGVMVYMRGHEGRGIGLGHKLVAYNLQDSGRDTVEANEDQGLPVDAREYGTSAQILRDLGVRSVRLMTNNPEKVRALSSYGITIKARVPVFTPITTENERYLETKRKKMGHVYGSDLEFRPKDDNQAGAQ